MDDGLRAGRPSLGVVRRMLATSSPEAAATGCPRVAKENDLLRRSPTPQADTHSGNEVTSRVVQSNFRTGSAICPIVAIVRSSPAPLRPVRPLRMRRESDAEPNRCVCTEGARDADPNPESACYFLTGGGRHRLPAGGEGG